MILLHMIHMNPGLLRMLRVCKNIFRKPQLKHLLVHVQQRRMKRHYFLPFMLEGNQTPRNKCLLYTFECSIFSLIGLFYFFFFVYLVTCCLCFCISLAVAACPQLPACCGFQVLPSVFELACFLLSTFNFSLVFGALLKRHMAIVFLVLLNCS